MIYPTAIHSAGVGWGQAAGRVGALAAPLLGGALLSLRLPTQQVLLAPAAAPGAGALCCGVLSVLCVRRYGLGLGDTAGGLP